MCTYVYIYIYVYGCFCKLRVLVVGVLIIKALLLGVYIRALIFAAFSNPKDPSAIMVPT